MKKLFKWTICSLLAFFVGCPANIAVVTVKPPLVVRDKWALVVGISKFQNASLDLRYAAKDAQDFGKYLVEEGHFAKDHVRVLTDERATRESILSELGEDWLPRVALPGDLVVIYIASHGSSSKMDAQGTNYLVVHNTNIDNLYATGISMQDLADRIKQRVHCNRVVIILDACHSGSAKVSDSRAISSNKNFDAEQLAQGTGQMVICSSEPSQLSWESKHHQNGVFTYNLIQALREKGGQARFNEVFDNLREKVQEEVIQDRGELQTPVMRSKWAGDDLLLAASPARPRKGLVDSREQDLAPYMDKVQELVKHHWNPPDEIGQKVIKLRFLVNQDGTISNVSVIESSGNKDWDQRAIAAVFSASPAPPLPPTVEDTKVGMECTFDCRVTRSGNKCSDANSKLPLNIAVLGMTTVGAADDKGKADYSLSVERLGSILHDELKEKYGNTILAKNIISDALKTNKLALPSGEASIDYWKNVGRAAQARYIVSGSLEEVPFADDPKKSIVVVVLDLVSGETGEVLRHLVATAPKKDPSAGDHTAGVGMQFRELMIPEMEEFMSSSLGIGGKAPTPAPKPIAE